MPGTSLNAAGAAAASGWTQGETNDRINDPHGSQDRALVRQWTIGIVAGYALLGVAAAAFILLPRVEFIGLLAASAVLVTFCMTSIRSLRLVAVVSNVLFILYGGLGHVYPVLLLHMVLLPINCVQIVRMSAD
jgi:hypothetical protein